MAYSRSSATPNWGISRQETSGSHRSPPRIQSWITGPAPPVPQRADQELQSDSYCIYRLEWSDLKTWLEKKFPGLKQPDRGKIKSDSWVFNCPRKLNEDDDRSIAAMRDQIYRRKEEALAAAAATARADASGRGGYSSSNRRHRLQSPERQRLY